MIKAKEATIMAKAAELDESILNRVSVVIITRASKGKYFADITSIMAGVSSEIHISSILKVQDIQCIDFGIIVKEFI